MKSGVTTAEIIQLAELRDLLEQAVTRERELATKMKDKMRDAHVVKVAPRKCPYYAKRVKADRHEVERDAVIRFLARHLWGKEYRKPLKKLLDEYTELTPVETLLIRPHPAALVHWPSNDKKKKQKSG